MAELTRKQLKAAADRASELTLADDDVALITSDTMPEGVGVRGKTLDTAGSDAHGPVYSFTRKQVDKALTGMGKDSDQDADAPARSSRRRASNGRRKGSRGRQQDTETGTRTTPADQTDQPTKPSGTTPPAPAQAEPEDAGKRSGA
jgi:hypothetical protein